MEGGLAVYVKEPHFDDPLMYQLYQQVEQTLGIRASTDALVQLRKHLNQIQTSVEPNQTAALPTQEKYKHIFASSEALFDLAQLLTVNETYFFREQVHFSLLLRELLPRFSTLGRSLRICSAATSAGCEAYSIAMVFDYYNQCLGLKPLCWEIDAFDINRNVIETAHQGRYTANAFREDGTQWKFLLDRYVSAAGAEYTVDPRLKDHIHFYLHNIMEGLPIQGYDLIFFRNVFIYFSLESRIKVMNILADALLPNACLMVGISETASIEHPLLTNRFKENAFYFQKKAAEAGPGSGLQQAAPRILRIVPKHPEVSSRKKGLAIEPDRIAALIVDDTEARLTTEKILAFLAAEQRRNPKDEGLSCMGNEFMTAIIALINQEDFLRTDRLLTFIEQYDNSAYTNFLRGEYFYLKTMPVDAEYSYKRAIQQDKTFWPAFYRLTSLAAQGNPVRYVYKINQALESIRRGKERGYEVFIGGFSPDYYQRALEKQRNKGLLNHSQPR
jgi:chemotaxis protein methyltransferase CheR